MKKFSFKSARAPLGTVKAFGFGLLLLGGASLDTHAAASNSIARVWNERALAAIRQDTPHPPAQARNYFSFSVCMYDAWAAYDPVAVGYVYRGKHTAANIQSARSNAISYAVYRMMKERHVYSKTAANTLSMDDALMTSLGYDINDQSRDTSTPTGVGNAVYDAVSAWFINDGARQTNGTPYNPATPGVLPIAYPDAPVAQGGYVYINPALATDRPGIDNGFGQTVVDINRWQRLNVVNAVDQNGFPTSAEQKYLGAQWLGVRPFAMTRADPTKPWIDPGPPPLFGTASHEDFRSNVVEVIRYGSQLTPDDGVIIDISPLSQGNNSLGANDGHGRPINPITGQPYVATMAKRGDFARALTEFWADGPNSETPPGHWNVIANDVSDNPLTVKRIGGTGPVVDDLEWDVKMYFALNAALHEAACAAWSVKRYYDGWRPMSAIRYMGGIGQCTDSGLPSFHANGLPLVPGLIELVTPDFAATNVGLTVGKIAVLAWPGETPQRVSANGVHFIPADTWTTYQRSNFVTPAFPGYISGHSTFTRSAAELLTKITGSPFFPGGLGTYTITHLANEFGPSEPVTLQWATYFDAGDQVGISRIWGGIHPPADDFAGRRVGSICGSNTWALAQRYFEGTVSGHPSNSIARVWNERALAAIRQDTPHPPAQARNYFSFSVCMYDAWAAYDPVAVGYVYRGKHTANNTQSARSNAISYAVYRMMKERHVYSKTAANTLSMDDALMTSLGYDINDQSRDTSTPTGVGNSVYDAVSAWFINDGARQANGTPYNPATPGVLPIAYPDAPVGQGGYAYINPALATDRPGIDNGFGQTVVDINHWQRLNVVNAVDQNGFPTSPEQKYLGAQWLGVRPFSLMRTDPTKAWIDPGPPPYFGGATHAQFVKEIVANITADGQLTPDDGVMIDISPGAQGNNSLNYEGDYGNGNFEIFDGHGYANNPVTGQPYAPNLVKRGDYARVLAEFWADGPNSETPPGHWNVLANYVSDHPLLAKRIGGTGPFVDDLEWDVKMLFALNAAVHDAACAAWSAKRAYDGWRPMSAIRYLAALGQSSNPALPSYHPNGLPLIPDQIELVTEESSAESGRHAGLTPGKIAVRAWPGPPTDAVNQYSGVKWIHGDAWSTYQRTNFVTPPFPGYISGHSTFSRSAAELLTGLTGSRYFPGGLGTFANYSLGFEKGPSVPMTLQWASYYDAADEAGISRIWGGIHPPIDNLIGRRVGSQVGKGVWELARRYFDGSVTNTPVTMTRLNPGQYEVRYTALRGFYYQLRSASDASQPFVNDPPGTSDPYNALSVARTNSFSDPQKFHRAVSSLIPFP